VVPIHPSQPHIKYPIIEEKKMKSTRWTYITIAALTILALILSACQQAATPTAMEEPTQAPAKPTNTTAPSPTTKPTEPPPTATEVPPTETPVLLGSPDNPIIMALAPSATTQELIASGEDIAKQLTDITGYTIKTTVPNSYGALVEAMGSGNAHIGWLPPFAYVIAKEKGYAEVGLATVRFGADHYGSQFIANVDSGFTSYFDEATGKNTADAATAMAQFDGKKPCWTDPLSSSGYVIPSGYVLQTGIKIQAAAFVQGHPTVVRALYAKGICDFGATFVDARTSSALQADLPDVMEKIVVIWRTDPIIPNDNVSFATNLPADVRQKLVDAMLQLSGTEAGKTALQSVYQIEALKVVDDTFYDEFRVYLEASGVDVTSLVK
jgi:phosphonate transport system substrate-binding protein